MTPETMRNECARLKALAAPYNGVSRGQMAEKLRPEVLDLFALCTAQAARIVELEAGASWQPIATAPRDTSVLVCCMFEPYPPQTVGESYFDSRLSCWYTMDGTLGRLTYYQPHPTHWMKLPEPPK